MKCRIIYDLCTPTRDRRPTYIEDVYDDVGIKEFDNEEELYEFVATELVDWNCDTVEEFEAEAEIEDSDMNVKEKIEYALSFLNDPGDGSANVLYCSIDGNELEETFAYDCLMELDLENCSLEDVRKAIVDGYVLEDKEDEDDEYDQELIYPIDESKLDIDEVIGWISEHNMLYEDFKEVFEYEYNEDTGEEVNKPAVKDIVAWLFEHPQAFEDFKEKFELEVEE